MPLNFIIYIKKYPKLSKVSKMSFNFQQEFKNTLTVSFGGKLLKFYFKIPLKY